MNLYYFHIRNGHTVLDDVGSRLPSMVPVKAEALKASCEMLPSVHSDLWDGTPWRLWVTDCPNATGETLLAPEFSAILREVTAQRRIRDRETYLNGVC
jgi:hypothetical protein